MIKKKTIKVLKHFYELQNSKKRYVLFRGSTRSGKTVSIIQYLISLLTNEKDIHIVIGVETLSSAKGNLIKDLDEWIEIFDLLDYMKINKSDFTYKYLPSNSTIRIVPCDKDTKWFGISADVFWFNEATHIQKSFFDQAQMRLPDTKPFNKIILDFNPTNPYSWVRDLETSKLPGGVDVYISTYKDNPFLGKKQVALFESWKETNPNKWLVFGQGQYGEVRGAIYTNWKSIDKFPDIETVWYGLDFGFSNDPTSLIKVGIKGGDVYIEELIYERGLTNPDICERMRELGIGRNVEIIADSAEPKSIEEIKREGFYVIPAKKGKDSIMKGIDILQRYRLYIKGRNIQDEIINYTWKEDRKKGEFINAPVDGWNHALDALRYVALMKLGTKHKGPTIIFRPI